MKLHNRLCVSLATGLAVAICGTQALQYFRIQRLFAEVGDKNAGQVKQRLSESMESLQRSVEFGLKQAL